MPFVRRNNTNRMVGELSFVTTTVVDWIDIFTRPKYKHIVLDSLAYCQKNKGLVICAWVLMPNHFHAIMRAEGDVTLAEIIRDFKKFTSQRIVDELTDDTKESRRHWMLDRFHQAGVNSSKIKNYRLWQEGYHVFLLGRHDTYMQKLNYIHNNPVKHEFVAQPEDYLYSSAKDYAGYKGLLDVMIVT